MVDNPIIYDETNVELELEYGLWSRSDIQFYAKFPERLETLPPLTRRFITRDPESGTLTVSYIINILFIL